MRVEILSKLYTPRCGFIKSFVKGDECEIDWWEKRVSESGEGEWERRWSVRVRVSESVRLVCVRERVSESGDLEWGVNFEKTSIWNRVLKTWFPGLPRGSSTSQPDRHVDATWEIKSLRLDFQVDLRPCQIWSKHENRVSKTRFIGPKSSLWDSRY